MLQSYSLTARWRRFCCALVFGAAACALVAPAPALAAISFGQLDNFQDGLDSDWHEGDPSTNPPVVIGSGGPRGGGDAFLRNESGGFGPGSRQVMFNSAQWAGNYAAAGVTRVDASLANFGESPLFMRLALQGGVTWYGSAEAVELPPDGMWRRVTFELTPGAFAKIEGTATLAQVLANVGTLRILSAPGGPTQRGEVVTSILGVDDLRALRLPGDANFDGRVDSADFRAVRLNLGTSAPAGAAGWGEGDFDFSGRVDARDVLLLRRNFGQSIPPAAVTRAAVLPVPEPAVGSLLLLGVAGVLLPRPVPTRW